MFTSGGQPTRQQSRSLQGIGGARNRDLRVTTQCEHPELLARTAQLCSKNFTRWLGRDQGGKWMDV